MKTRNGKIARLPRSARDELNHRLDNGESAGAILPWLNALPAVRAVLAGQFEANPVNPQNLTNWRQGGYQQWLKQHEHNQLVRELAHDAKELAAHPDAPALASHLSTVLLAQLTISAREAQTELTDPTERFERLRQLLQTVGQVRREDNQTARLALDRDRQAFAQAKEMNHDGCLETVPANRQILQSLLDHLNGSPAQTRNPAPAKKPPNQGETR